MGRILSGHFGNKGVTLITLVVAITIFGVLVSVFSRVMIAKHGSEALYVSSTRAYAIAQAGIEYGMRYGADYGYDTFPITKTLGNGSFEIVYLGSTETEAPRIKSTGTSGSAERTIFYHMKTMYVEDITLVSFSVPVKKKIYDKWVEATVTVYDITGTPMVGATVDASWSGDVKQSDSQVTDGSGQALFVSKKKTTSKPATFIFTVDNVTRTGYTYEPNLNKETSDSITF